MPQPRITRSNGGAPSAEVTPEEAAKIRASAAGREQAPSSRQQALFSNWREAANTLGSPFEVERIPMSKLRAMRRDPMLGFGLSFIKTPHVRAKWFINAKSSAGPNAQVSAHLDHDLRKIYASLVLQYCNCIDFGFQAIAKRFEFRTPSGTYIAEDAETGERTAQPIWDEGSVQPLAWKPFVALPPELVEPIWAGDGSFNGIDFSGTSAPPGIGANKPGDKNFRIDLWHSLWVTNEKEANFGSIYGYPRLGYAFRYWWSYWFRWAIADRAFERKADPSVLVRHPDEDVDLGNGESMPAHEYALLMGERMRSGGVLALPSDVYEDTNGRGTVRQWDIEFTKDATNFEPFDKSFDYIDVQKLRSLFIPEQAFLEGKGGTSSRNVAAEMGESFIESQAVFASGIVEHVNRFVIPQWLAINYPEFLAEGGSADLVMQGFADEDVAFMNQVITLIGQQESGMREILKLVDLKRVLEARGTPIAPFEEQQRREREMAAEAAAAGPPTTEPVPGAQVGIVPSATGFSYVQPREVIHLTDTATDFIENLPDSHHYQDKAVRGFARQLWRLYRDLYRDEYETAFSAISSGDISLADIDIETDDEVELALPTSVRKAARAIREWGGSSRWPGVLDRTRDIFMRLAKRAARIEAQRVNLSARLDEGEFDDWVRDHMAEMVMKVAETTRTEIRDFVASQIEMGIFDREEIVASARARFVDFPNWKADRLVRTEVRDIYNAATLHLARAAGIDTVQATDADSGDTDQACMDRDGKIFTVSEALREREHPNGTLGWRIIPITSLSIERVPDVGIPGAVGNYLADSQTILLSEEASPDDERRYLKLIGEALCERAVTA